MRPWQQRGRAAELVRRVVVHGERVAVVAREAGISGQALRGLLRRRGYRPGWVKRGPVVRV